MAIHKLNLEDFLEDVDYILIAIHSRLEDYRLAYYLNKNLNLSLTRSAQDVDYEYFSAAYSIFEWKDEINLITYNLVSNICKREEDSLQSSGSLFANEEKIIKSYNLIPELKNVDYLMKITKEDLQISEQLIVNKIQEIPQVITTYTVNVDQIKSKDNLIFN
ncbi:IPExxxVDY family protein [uncultured Formosa sp.]|uniref:IPExxxVDY family protein n=1 Tax=uncultured Formosa sp. TaxID=255435 RepID=UPI00260CE9EB|nr:IPExxxVDY family protein [uncultured Formosa sp.]